VHAGSSDRHHLVGRRRQLGERDREAVQQFLIASRLRHLMLDLRADFLHRGNQAGLLGRYLL